MRRVGGAEVQVIVEGAYRLECEVVREIGAHSAIDVVSYATERTSADRAIQEKEHAENEPGGQRIGPGTMRRRMTRPGAKPLGFSIGACTRLRYTAVAISRS
jgi:hypothetical protein